jgi:hypothetical protein
MTHELVIGGGLLATGDGTRAADLGIAAGRIAAIRPHGELRGEARIDARDLLVLPAAIDMHVHLREPGFERKEDFWHGTRAAAAGGVALVADMPNTQPPVADAGTLAQKAELLRDSAWVDVALWAGGTNVSELAAMQRAGAIGLKVYMTRPRRADDPYSSDLSMPDDETFRPCSPSRRGWAGRSPCTSAIPIGRTPSAPACAPSPTTTRAWSAARCAGRGCSRRCGACSTSPPTPARACTSRTSRSGRPPPSTSCARRAPGARG